MPYSGQAPISSTMFGCPSLRAFSMLTLLCASISAFLLASFSSFYGFSAPGSLFLLRKSCLFQSSFFFYSPAIQLRCLYNEPTGNLTSAHGKHDFPVPFVLLKVLLYMLHCTFPSFASALVLASSSQISMPFLFVYNTDK
ncbi:hypothetical protein NC652_018341 [Populus alba x Populus x berolinensis]|nr:hypothetical protein NC652_018341 [Populus alba x Populus x berolinensis]